LKTGKKLPKIINPAFAKATANKLLSLLMLPEKFIERIQEILPKSEQEAFYKTCTEPLPKTIRRAPDAKLPQEWTLDPVAGIPEAAFLSRPNQKESPLGKTFEHFCGHFYVATLSSLLPIKILDPQPDEKILDMCAAPGSKATFISERMEHSGVLVANELSSSRSKKLTANLDRMGCTNVVVTQSDGTFMNNFIDQEFDKILLDAPCSSEGYGRKDSKFFSTMWSEQKIFGAAKIQKKLIESAFKMLRPGGTLVYSTCTSAPEENEAVVEHLCKTFGDYLAVETIDLGDIPHTSGVSKFYDQLFDKDLAKKVKRLWPHKRSDQWNSECFFIAKIQKTAPLPKTNPVKKHLRGLDMLGKNNCAEVFTRLHKAFGFPKELFAKKTILDRDGLYFLASKPAGLFALRNLHRRAGIPLLDKDKNLESAFSIAFGHFASKNIVQLDRAQADRWKEGFDLPFETTLPFPNSTEVLVLFHDFCLGTGKIMKEGKKLKNKLNRELIHS